MATYDDYEKVLSRNYGSLTNYRLYPNYCITEGVKDMCDTMNCYWINDVVFSYLPEVKKFVDKHIDEDMSSDLLEVRFIVNDNKCDFAIVGWLYDEKEEDEVEKDIVTQHIPYTDLPDGEYKLFLGDQWNDKGTVAYKLLFLTSEY